MDESHGPAATLFDDRLSNITEVARVVNMNVPGDQWQGLYFEGSNIAVYIRGREDPDGEWWTRPRSKPMMTGGVLVNAHFDSYVTPSASCSGVG